MDNTSPIQPLSTEMIKFLVAAKYAIVHRNMRVDELHLGLRLSKDRRNRFCVAQDWRTTQTIQACIAAGYIQFACKEKVMAYGFDIKQGQYARETLLDQYYMTSKGMELATAYETLANV